jgi:putative NADH-flavin reductase
MPPRNILVLGATGGTGQHVVSQALQQGHEVTAFVRDPARLTARSEHLKVITGDVTADGGTLQDAVRGHDAVISALGVGNSLKSGGLIARSVPAILRAMEAQGLRRLILTSAYGVGETIRDVPLVPRLVMGLLFGDLYADKAAGDELVRQSSLDWTIVHPVTLTNRPATGKYRTGERLSLSGMPTVSRADVADFLIRQTDDRTWLHKSVLIAS